MGPQRMFGMTPWVRRLLVANLLVFLIQETVFLGAARALEFDPLNALARPWTAVAYMFLHGGFLHLAFNLLALYVFGPSVEARMGGRAFIGFYFFCGICGALLSYALVLLPHSGPIVGASAAIYGVALAFAWFWPDEPIYVFPLPEPVSAKWLVVFVVLLSLALPLLGLEPGVAHAAHLGGFAGAFLWLRVDTWRLARADRRLRGSSERGVLVHPATLTARGGGRESPKPRARTARTARTAGTAGTPERPNSEIDRVLDKISASGYGSLTPAEKRFLTEMSRKMRDHE